MARIGNDHGAMHIGARWDTKRLQRDLSVAAYQQVPFATALAITRLAKLGKEAVEDEMLRVFDAPTNWTLKSLFLRKATKDNPEALVWFKDFAPKGTPASKYLVPEVFGGDRSQKRFERSLTLAGKMRQGQFAVPGKDAPLDKSGNMRGSYISAMLNDLRANVLDTTQQRGGRTGQGTRRRGRTQGRFFVMFRGDEPIGIYNRRGRNKLLHILTFTRDKPDYEERLPFFTIMNDTVAGNFDKEFGRALAYALATDRNR